MIGNVFFFAMSCYVIEGTIAIVGHHKAKLRAAQRRGGGSFKNSQPQNVKSHSQLLGLHRIPKGLHHCALVQ